MNPLQRNVLAGLIAVVVLKVINFARSPETFDILQETVEAVIFVVVFIGLLTLFERWRGKDKEAG